MPNTRLHYVHDPLCGWCYGAAPLVAAARAVINVQAHGGGMMAGAQRQRVSPQLRSYVLPHDRRIAQMSGQPFGVAYTDGLLNDPSAVLDSEPPIAAVLAADRLGGRGLDLLARLQRAHYVEGRQIAQTAVLAEMAVDIGLEASAFVAAFEAVSGEPTQRHIAESRALLSRLGGRGFPTFAIERDGGFTVIDLGGYFGEPQRWQEWLRTQVTVR